MSSGAVRLAVNRGLHTYIQPENLNNKNNNTQSGVQAAIRRPDTTESEEPKKRNHKSKDEFEFDENHAQIFRLQLTNDHIRSQIYFTEYRDVLNYLFIAISSIVLHSFLNAAEGFGLVFVISPNVLDFEFDSIDGVGKIWIAIFAGVLQIITLRRNLKMFLNKAVLSWYQRLHASKVLDLDFSRVKIFLHNYYLSLVVLQFLIPPALVLLFLRLSKVEGVQGALRVYYYYVIDEDKINCWCACTTYDNGALVWCMVFV
ncbi:hypothetical protein IFM89_009124 [Coptis chinensis]|uniref:Uncharacterized protein n=1 Tax=Coptis chinensis TaxID=261450 RepID=A0A835LQT4_9MAGN|nr:hypothetical protein IFM89_009124 [Coptis chinensis]